MNSFLLALSYPFRGVAFFLRRPGLWKYAAAAFAINLALFALLAVLFFKHRADLVSWITPARFPPWLRSALGWILTGLAAAAGLFLFTIVGNLLATPFLDAMTERILRELGEQLPAGRGPGRALLRALVNQTLKLALFGGVQALLLLFLLTPVAFLHPPLSAFLAVLFLGFEYADYPLAARSLSVPDRVGWLLEHLGAALGFGTVILAILWIPLLGYLFLPLAVAGASLLAHDLDRPSSKM
jgi:CysZ protein